MKASPPRTAAAFVGTLALACLLGLASEPDGATAGEIAVVSQGAGTLARFDAEQIGAANITAHLTTPSAPKPIGSNPAVIIAAPNNQAFVSFPDERRIRLIDVASGTIAQSFTMAGQPFGLAFADGALYASDWANDRVIVLDPTSGTASKSIKVGRGPAHLALDREAHRLYVADRDSNDVTVVDTLSDRVIAIIPVGRAPFALALLPDGSRLFVADVQSNDVVVIDTHRLQRSASIAMDGMPYGVAATPDGAFVLATNQHGGTLSVVDTTSLRVVARIAVGRYPEGVVCGRDGHAYVANWFSDDVSVVDIEARREVARVKVGDGPRNLALIGTR